jgi:hypothetical protein
MKPQDIPLDRLLGRLVLARDNQPVGRLHDFRTERHANEYIVNEYVIGAGGLLERLGLGMRLIVGLRPHGRIARWDQLDIGDPEHPRLTCDVEQLREL